MRRFFLAAVLLSACPAVAFAQAGTASRAAAGGDLRRQVLDLERQRVAAMVSKDLETLDRLLGDDLSYTHSGGSIDTKDSFITLIKERGRYEGVDYSNTEVIPWGGNAVIVRGIATIRLTGVDPYPVLFLDVWALRNGAWQMVAWQATRARE